MISREKLAKHASVVAYDGKLEIAFGGIKVSRLMISNIASIKDQLDSLLDELYIKVERLVVSVVK